MATVTPIPPPGEQSATSVLAPFRRPRIVGAAVGAGLGLAGMALLYLLGSWVGSAEQPAFALVIGADGIFSPTAGAPFVWVVPPLAAAIAGGILGGRAARRAPLAGISMGYLTYAIGILLGPIFVFFLPGLGEATADMGAVGLLDSVLGLLIGIGVLWLVGAIILAPVLAVCAAAGVAWAALVRAALPSIGPRRDPAAGDATVPTIALVVIGGVLALLWVVATTILQILVDSQAT